MPALNLLDVVDFLRRHALRIGLAMLVFGAVGYAVSFAIPRIYRATSSILPPEEEDSITSLQLARRNLSNLGGLGRISSYFTQVDIAMAVLRSQSIHENIVKDFDLQQVYGKKRLDDAIKQLRDRTKVRLATDGTISVTVEDGDAQRSADLANRFFAELDLFNQKFRTFRARRSRVFLETRVAETDSLLRAAERQLGEYQKRKGTIVIPPDVRGGLESAADLMVEKSKAEVELELMRQYASPQSEEFRRLQARVEGLRRQLGGLPQVMIGGAELIRESEVQQQLYAYLKAQLEDARMREAMDVPTIQVLDRASAPTRHSWPRRKWIAAFGALVGGLAAFTTVRKDLRLWRTPM